MLVTGRVERMDDYEMKDTVRKGFEEQEVQRPDDEFRWTNI